MDPREAVVRISDLAVRAGRKTILRIEGFELKRGELVAVMGPNGAGKSTLLRACLGLQPHVTGRVSVFGQRVDQLSGSGLAGLRRRIGYVPQQIPVRGELPLTVREVVSIGRTSRAGLFHPLSRDDWRAVDQWIDRLGLGEMADRTFSEISGGEQRKAIIARAMAQEPEWLLLDEPTANLDLGWRERIVETIESLYSQTGLVVLLVCHELEVLPPSCRRVVLLEQGAIVAGGSPESVFTTERVARLYGPGLQPVHLGGRHAVIPGGAAHD